MSRKSVAIFGVSSGLARKIVEQLKVRNYHVIPYSSNPDSANYFNLYEPTLISFCFDYAIYFSWAIDRSWKSQKMASRAASEFARRARENNVDVIFISSLAALPSGRKSNYGLAKQVAEKSMQEYGHSIVRPATVLSEVESASSAYEELFKKRFLLWVFSHFSNQLLLPTINVSRLSEVLIDCVEKLKPIEINLIEDIGNIENLAGVRTPFFRVPIRWNFIGILPTRSRLLDRLLTVISVSDWIKENQDLFESKT